MDYASEDTKKIGEELIKAELNITFFFNKADDRQHGGYSLRNNGCNSNACNVKTETDDKNKIEYNVYDA